VEVQKELVKVTDGPSEVDSKRGKSLLPGEIESTKSSDSRKTLAVAKEEENVNDSFVQYLEVQKELVKVTDGPSEVDSKRGKSLLPDEIESTKSSDSRKTLAVAIEEENVNDSFVQYLEVQKELLHVNDEPTTSNDKRAHSLSREDTDKSSDNRKTLPATLRTGETSEEFLLGFLEEHEEQKKQQAEAEAAALKKGKRRDNRFKTNSNNHLF